MRGQRGRDHRAGDRDPRFGDAQADAKEEMTVDEVGRAIQRIAVPGELVAGRRSPALFFTDDGEFRSALGEPLPDQALARQVVLGD